MGQGMGARTSMASTSRGRSAHGNMEATWGAPHRAGDPYPRGGRAASGTASRAARASTSRGTSTVFTEQATAPGIRLVIRAWAGVFTAPAARARKLGASLLFNEGVPLTTWQSAGGVQYSRIQSLCRAPPPRHECAGLQK